MPSLLEILSIVSRLPDATKLIGVAQQAMQGNPDAIQYLKTQGIWEALDVFRPGTGGAAQQIKQHLEVAGDNIQRTLSGNVIDGQWREVGPPWMEFLGWIKARRWGTFVILGPKGGGKSTLAMRLAQVWHEKTGWPVLAVNAYPEERHDFVKPVAIRGFIQEVKAIVEMLNKPVVEEGEGDEENELWSLDDLRYALERYRRRIVVIDEMSLAISPSGQDANRHLLRQVMAQARHLDWLIIYIGQLVRMLPQDLLGSEAVFIKRPSGRETLTDRQEPLTIDLWSRAREAFRHVESAPSYEEYSNVKSWAYVDCQDMGGGRRYQGLMPFSVPWLVAEAESEEVSE